MNKLYSLAFVCLLTACIGLPSCRQHLNNNKEMISEAQEKEAGYDGPAERDQLEFEKTKDPATGKVPTEKLLVAINETEYLKNTDAARVLNMNWIERGPVYDSLGPSNGNFRGGFGTPPNTYTAGRIRAVLLDPTDPTGNTLWAAGINGGLWKTTNLLASVPLWQNINDFFDNMAISSICIDPSNTNIMYFSTGEPTANADAVQGLGIWKSTDHGSTWSILPSTTGFTRTFKLLCDNSGNVYAALRNAGLSRSTNGGNTWTSISPNLNSACDIEVSSTGTMHLALGYFTSAGTAKHYFTTSPSTVTSATWGTSTGLPASANRLEIATKGDTVYVCPTSTGNNVFGTYLSTDDGVSFVQKQTSNYTTSLSNTQGWYGISLDINPDNAAQLIIGGLDAYRSLDTGKTVQRLTYWFSTSAASPYVHADHHYVKWFRVGTETRILMATDGGIFLSRNNGVTYADKNRNLGIKQFYSCAIHPTLPNYFLAGAQDNGSHQLNNPGLTYSFEVTGGDGAFVDIDQNEPQFQFTSYVYNEYRRSTNGGSSWTNFDITGGNGPGLFINPFDYDDINNKFFASYGTSMMRWNNPTTATNVATSDTDLVSIPGSSGNHSAFLVSPNTDKRLYVGTSNGQLFKVDRSDVTTNADIATNTTNITGAGFSGYINCIAEGSTDQQLLAIFSNYNVNNVWYSSNGGTTWTAIDGNLPNMPVRWAVFDPVNNDKVILATEAGVYVTRDVNGASTQWLPSADFPTVRTDMLKVRQSDQLILAATHGRGLWSSYTYTIVPVKNINLEARLDNNGVSNLSWASIGAVNATKFNIQFSLNGISFTDIATVGSSVSNFKHSLSSAIGYYRIMSVEQNNASVYSNIVVVRSSKPTSGLKLRISPNPVSSSGNFVLTTHEYGAFKWMVSDMQGRMVQSGYGSLAAGGSMNLPVQLNTLASGQYNLLVIQNKSKVQSSFIRQ